MHPGRPVQVLIVSADAPYCQFDPHCRSTAGSAPEDVFIKVFKDLLNYG
ncbi:hypothetical protein EHW99_1850 [Erwinia amylovora]|uniref:Uncharacterized protein n=3 Tax=Erwinia amylovora TaxID=552 RepID=A0A831EJW2_ERWAM|nr:hypothetical protein EaACW_1739 [Erwinia amylovora ACW56400]QJQ54554.1 hypothetical protein EHX00_1850 [Erwinia amylovora]CBA20684.1 hypothetical protein predicted by Glimmer/Critica [Erwinia amylovora CFBP1430]CBX80604.1 hypothetical protein predicted by Glimmer/Critica [Erwinia amylovora ATCC BAA-2158]CCO78587.1 hypothetical protein BN432_1789 [Erwinia amylovora Ea356]CCO86168.1 hypothetical protein BN434_1780 [Erwinia amylovora CFBP 2585]CCO93714.1 hypothetical protein BN437_1784 [Erwin